MSGKFVGGYIHDMEIATAASAISGVNLMFIGAPGMGKTRFLKTAIQQIFGDAWIAFQLNPSSDPAHIGPHPDPAELTLSGKWVEVVEGSVLDPNAKVVLLDEFPRASDPVYDYLLGPLAGDGADNKPLPESQRKTFMLTANFRVEGDRNKAINDRVGIILPLPDDLRLEIRDLVRSALSAINSKMEINDGLPTAEDVERVRAYVPDDNPDAVQAVEDVIAALEEEAYKGIIKDGEVLARFEVNPRRAEQWATMLYRYSAFLTGDPNFKVVPDKAKRVLQWMYPCKDDKEAGYWREVCGAIADPIASAIDTLLKDVFDSYKEKAGDINDPARKMTAMRELGNAMADGKRRLVDLAAGMGAVDAHGQPTDPRVQEAMGKLVETLGKVTRGENPF